MSDELIPLPQYLNDLATEIFDISMQIHKTLGPGLLESVYEKCFCYELAKRNIRFVSQKEVPVHYQNLRVDSGLRIDLMVEDSVIVELKAQENYHKLWEAQLLSYLRLSGKRLGLIVNFNVLLIKNGVKRIVL